MRITIDSDDVDHYSDLPGEIHEAVTLTMAALGSERYGNLTLKGVKSNGRMVRVKAQLGHGESLHPMPEIADGLGNRDPRVWHSYDDRHGGRLVGVHPNGWVTIEVMATI